MTSSCRRCGSQLASDELICRSCGKVNQQPEAPALADSQPVVAMDPDATMDRGTLNRLIAQDRGEEARGEPEAPRLEVAPEPEVPVTRPAVNGQAAMARVDRSWSARISRGIHLAGQSWQLMRAQPGLLLVPISTAGAIAGLYVVALLLMLALPGGMGIVFLLAAIAGMAVVSMVGQSVIVHRVATVVSGGQESNRDALQGVRPYLWNLAKWGLLSASVGALIRSIERGRGVLGLLLRIVAVVINVAWSAATFFVLPVMLFEGLEVMPAIRRSRQIVRDSWGEGVVGIGVLSLLLNLAGFAAVVLAMLLFAAGLWVLSLLLILATVVGINLLASVASPVFTVVLYNFVTSGELALGFSEQDLAGAFRVRRRRVALNPSW